MSGRGFRDGDGEFVGKLVAQMHGLKSTLLAIYFCGVM